MLAALQAFERTPGEKRVGYEVLLSPDEEVGSLASAPLLAELGARAHLGMTYEPSHGGRRAGRCAQGLGQLQPGRARQAPLTSAARSTMAATP